MSEIPAPPEIEKEAANTDSPESSKPEANKNHNIQKFFDGFHSSPEYQKGLDERKRKLKPNTAIPDLYLARGYEGFGAPSQEEFEETKGRTIIDTREFKKASEEYKGAYMDYIGQYYDQYGEWPIYFSPDQHDRSTVEAYERYKKAAELYNRATGRVNVVEDADVDIGRSKAHDDLAMLLFRGRKVKSFSQGALLGRMWLVADGIDHPAAITNMDRARLLRDFHRSKNIATLDSK